MSHHHTYIHVCITSSYILCHIITHMWHACDDYGCACTHICVCEFLTLLALGASFFFLHTYTLHACDTHVIIMDVRAHTFVYVNTQRICLHVCTHARCMGMYTHTHKVRCMCTTTHWCPVPHYLWVPVSHYKTIFFFSLWCFFFTLWCSVPDYVSVFLCHTVRMIYQRHCTCVCVHTHTWWSVCPGTLWLFLWHIVCIRTHTHTHTRTRTRTRARTHARTHAPHTHGFYIVIWQYSKEKIDIQTDRRKMYDDVIYVCMMMWHMCVWVFQGEDRYTDR